LAHFLLHQIRTVTVTLFLRNSFSLFPLSLFVLAQFFHFGNPGYARILRALSCEPEPLLLLPEALCLPIQHALALRTQAISFLHLCHFFICNANCIGAFFHIVSFMLLFDTKMRQFPLCRFPFCPRRSSSSLFSSASLPFFVFNLYWRFFLHRLAVLVLHWRNFSPPYLL